MKVPAAGPSRSGDVDTSQLSAYAVYNNLVPGVNSYQDTSESTAASKRKKSKKKANKKAAAAAEVKNELNRLAGNKEGKSAPTPSTNGQSSSSKSNGQAAKANGTGNDESKKKAKAKAPEAKTPVVADSPEVEQMSKRSKKKRNRKNRLRDSTGTPTDTVGEQQNTPSPATPTKDSDETFPGKKKQKKNKKKRKSDEAANLSQIANEEAPPTKLRKMNKGPELVPNPLAAANKINLATEGKEGPQPGSTPSKKKKKNKGENITENSNGLSSKNIPVSQSHAPSAAGRKPKFQKLQPVIEINDDDDSEPETALVPVKKGKKSISKPSELQEEEYGDSADYPNVFDVINAKPIQDSIGHGESLMKWLIHPQSISSFKSKFWEKTPLLIKRNQVFPEYYEWILSTAALDNILRNNVLKYSENLDITSYENGVRETISKEMTGRARPAAVWDYYSTGHSVRILNPQTYCKPLWRLNASLQEWFGCFVGANVYLTPPDSQGFAPHYDDIEAFILQVEGKKRWKLYRPKSENEKLPRYSSPDFKEDDTFGELVMDVILEQGDLIYFPRGWIHQAKTVDGEHSMHITLSCYQQNTWADLLKQHFAKTLDKLTAKDVDFRRGLPMDYLSFMGIAHSSNQDKNIVEKRKAFKKTLTNLMQKVMNEDADDGADEMGKKFIWDSLPPYFTRREKDTTVVEDGEFLADGRVKNRVEMDPDVEVKLLRKNCIRLMDEENTLRLYFSIENSLVYHADEPQFLEIPDEFRPAVEHLIKTYPEFTRIEDLPMESDDVTKKIQLVSDFWERGILMTKKPLEAGEIDEEDFELDAASDESFIDETDDDNAYTETDDSCSDDDEEQSGDDDFIDDSYADMDGAFISDDDVSNMDDSNEDIESASDDGAQVREIDGSEESGDDGIDFEELSD